MSSKHPLVVDFQGAVLRLPLVQELLLGGRRVRVALPIPYPNAEKDSYPLVVVLDCGAICGSAVEMSRLMCETQEVKQHILVGIEGGVGDFEAQAASLATDILPALRQRFRVAAGKTILFGHCAAGAFVLHAALTRATGADQFIAGNPDTSMADAVIRKQRAAYQRNGGQGRRAVLASAGTHRADAIRSLAANMELIAGSDLAITSRHLESAPESAAAAPALVHGLRSLLSTGRAYGAPLAPMAKAPMPGLMKLVGPLLGKAILKKAEAPVTADAGHIVRSQAMQRDYEVFVSLPASAGADPARRYPALLAMDANIEFATVAETAAMMAAAGEIEETVVIGLGTPRIEGAVAFGFRRFEEFAPPTTGYDWNDELGRVFRSLFYTRSQDARERIGLAPRLHRFVTDELLPRLLRELPIDAARLGLLGHSASGTYAAYVSHQVDSPFKRYVCISPGVAISGNWLMHQEASPAAKAGAGLFLTIGGEEKGNRFNQIAGIPETEAYTLRLRGQSVAARYLCIEGETHSSVYPQGVAAGLAELYAVHPALQARRTA